MKKTQSTSTDSYRDLYKSAQSFYKANQFAEALDIFRVVERCWPQSDTQNIVNIKFSIALCSQKVEYFQGAIHYLKELVALCPNDIKYKEQLNKCENAQTEYSKNYMKDKFFLYVHQGTGIVYQPDIDTTLAGIVTDSFSSCVIIALLNHEKKKYCLIHADTTINPAQIEKEIKRIGEDCSKIAIHRGRSSKIPEGYLGSNTFRQITAGLPYTFRQIEAPDNYFYVTLMNDDVHMFTSGCFTGRILYHPNALQQHCTHGSNATFNPLPSLLNATGSYVNTKAIIIYANKQWFPVPSSSFSEITSSIIEKLKLNSQVPFEVVCQRFRKLLSEGDLSLLLVNGFGMLNDHVIKSLIMRLQINAFMSMGNYAEMLRINIYGLLTKYAKDPLAVAFINQFYNVCNKIEFSLDHQKLVDLFSTMWEQNPKIQTDLKDVASEIWGFIDQYKKAIYYHGQLEILVKPMEFVLQKDALKSSSSSVSP